MRVLDEKAFALSAAAVAVGWYLLCIVVVLAAPDLLFNLFGFIAHGVNLEPLRPSGVSLNLTNSLLGLALWSSAVWVTFYAGAALYNSLKKN